MALFLTIVLDGVGVGAQPDAARYGDEASHTLGHVCAAASPHLPNLQRLGLGNIEPLHGVAPAEKPAANYGRMKAVSPGKDSTTGHWELAGLRLERAFPIYPDGFPDQLIRRFKSLAGVDGVLGNRAASGTEIVAELGDEHVKTGYPIVYTSADSVFQIAAHEEVIPLERLYRMCEIARDRICIDEHAVGRVIARPFVGSSGAYERVSSNRKDYSVEPRAETLQQALLTRGVETISIGKVGDLFGGVGFSRIVSTRSNADGIARTLEQLRADDGTDRFIWVNLVDFDQEFGHRNDVEGFARALEEFDQAVPSILDALPQDGQMIITADHGNDPTTPGTDHSREYVPVLYYHGGAGRDIGTRDTFNDHAATVAEFFKVPFERTGASFLNGRPVAGNLR